jgi:hypothetical protein
MNPNPKPKLITGFFIGFFTLFLGSVAYWGLNELSSDGFEKVPCIRYGYEDLNPLIMGKTTGVSLGMTEGGSDCTGKSTEPVAWSSENPEVATIAPDGTIKAIAPGAFSITAKFNAKTLMAKGVVYPSDWTIRIQPETAAIHVGDQVTFQMVATDSKGNSLPPVFTFITTPNYQDPNPNLPDLVPNPSPWMDRSFHAMGSTPGTFRALRPGTIKITGKMAGQTRQATLTIQK